MLNEPPASPADAVAEVPAGVFDRLRRECVEGRMVTYRRLAGNSLIVYLECEPGDEQGAILWLEPTWHLRDAERVLAGSRQAQDEPEGFDATADAIDALVGRRLVALALDPVSHDLRVELEGGLVLQTFVSDPSDDHLWHIIDNSTRTRLRGAPDGLWLDLARTSLRTG